MPLITKNNSLQELLKTTQGKTYTVIIVTIILIVLMFSVAIVPAYRSVTDQIAQNRVKSEYLEQLSKKEDILRILANQENQYRQEIDIINQIYQSRQNDEFVLANLNSLANQFNIRISSFGFSNKTLQNSSFAELDSFANLQRITINLSLEGDLQDFQYFLNSLESLPLVISVTNINYGLNTSTERDIRYRYIMNLQAEYYFWNESSP
jgi:Tfp pilus assembly protein PilO